MLNKLIDEPDVNGWQDVKMKRKWMVVFPSDKCYESGCWHWIENHPSLDLDDPDRNTRYGGIILPAVPDGFFEATLLEEWIDE